MSIDVKEAKRLASLEQELVKKFKRAEKDERERNKRNEKQLSLLLPPSQPQPPPSLQPVPLIDKIVLPQTKTTPRLRYGTVVPPSSSQQQSSTLTVEKAKRLEALKSRVESDFADTHARELAERQENERKFEAITRTIREQQEKEKERKSADDRKAIEAKKRKRYKELMAFRPRVASTPAGKFTGYIGIEGNSSTSNGDTDDDDDEVEKMDVDVDKPESSTKTATTVRSTAAGANKSMKQLMDSKVITLGAIGARYLPKAKDAKFGIYYDEQIDRPKIGAEQITFDHDDILFVKEPKARYKGTEGVWRLLTEKDYLAPELYSATDWKVYKEILIRTDTLYHRNDPSSGRPKASQGRKWKHMIKPVWEELTASAFTGSGLAVYKNGDDNTESSSRVEYKYIKNLHELIGRLNYIHAQETAGNNNFRNEKLAVVRFLHDRMEELVQNHPNGVKYLVRCLSALPEKMMIEGAGLVNDIINRLPFELHAPLNWKFDTYNYCGPGTKLRERLARGDRGVNPLDEKCRAHDIWYRDHKRAEDRWVADKVLQKAAWDRVVSKDADLNERAVGLATTGAMWLKRKLGMGLLPTTTDQGDRGHSKMMMVTNYCDTI